MYLSALLLGEEANIKQIIAAGQVRRKMLEMGLLVNTKIKLIGSAPFGDPLEYEIRGYRISLRKEEAEQIVIELLK